MIDISDIKLLDTPVEDERLKEGLTSNVWKNLINSTEKSSSEKSMKEVHARIYYGGVEDSIRLQYDLFNSTFVVNFVNTFFLIFSFDLLRQDRSPLNFNIISGEKFGPTY